VCSARCSDLCKALASCDTPPADCEAQCTLGLGSECSGAPADQLTCKELSATYACADYCATLCTRAPECGSFDSKKCASGCASESPTICNPASVAARSCDQLKPEIRSYQQRAEVEESGGHVASGGFGSSYGLCLDASDCDAPLGCVVESNTCGSCTADADCASYTPQACSENKECVRVGCVKDADCPKFCDAASHECGECRNDSDCTFSFAPACNTETSKCVTCTKDADCAKSPIGSRCESTSNRCVECLGSADCADPKQALCDPTLQFCVTCKTDADCKRFAATPVCSYLGCSECNHDADCTDPSKETCDTIGHDCFHIEQ
jgi:hypothetical protein